MRVFCVIPVRRCGSAECDGFVVRDRQLALGDNFRGAEPADLSSTDW